jgi:hypothetical protein
LKYGGYNRIAEVCCHFKLWSVAHKLADRSTGVME